MLLFARRAFIVLASASALVAQPLLLDTTFAPNPTVDVRAAVVQSDRKLVVGGAFTQIAGVNRSFLARLNADGSFDAAFNPAVVGAVQAIALQGDGKILIGGQITSVGGLPRNRLARLNADGSVDAAFNANVVGNLIRDILVLPDGRILVAGDFVSIGGQPRTGLARLNANGTLDPTFVGDASERSSPTAAPGVFTLARQLDGRILIGGQFGMVNGQPRRGLARLSADGVLDAAFDPIGPTATVSMQSIIVQRDGRFIVAGSFTSIAGQTRVSIARFTPEGALDAGFNPRPNSAVFSVAEQPDGRILIGGLFSSIASTPRSYLALLHPDGQLDFTFTLEVTGTTVATSPGVQVIANSPDGRVVIGGSFTEVGAVPRAQLARLIPLDVARAEPRLANVSVRTRLANAQSLIVGFAVGNGSLPVLVRAAGPALNGFGVTGALADPRVELYRDSTKLVENDNWPAALASTFSIVGAFPFAAESRDAALLETVTGGHSVVASGPATGVVLVEAYEAGGFGTAKLVNLSARNQAGAGDDTLIAGFSIAGQGSIRVLVRAVGPTLGGAPFGVPGVLADPVLELYDQAGAKIAENDNYDAPTAAAFSGAGAFALAPGARDAALIATLAAGRSYTAQVKSTTTSTGVVLVEVYELR